MDAAIRCPKCDRPVVVTGEVTAGGAVYAVYQCDACKVPLTVDGDTLDVTLTFAVGPHGNIVDPVDPSQPLNLG